MNTSKLCDNVDYFHDGSIFEINHKNKELHIAMCSSQLKDGTVLAGILHISDIESIKVRGEDYHSEIKKRHDVIEILDFEIKDKEILLSMSLNDFPSKPGFGSDYIAYKIQAKKIDWEDVPGILNLYS